MTNFQERKQITLDRCRQFQYEVENNLNDTEERKCNERNELYRIEKDKIMKNYHDNVQVL